MKLFTLVLRSILAMLSLSLTACQLGHLALGYPFLYQPTVSQGNKLNADAVSQLKIGMQKAQVDNLLGSPVLKTPLSSDMTEYIYTVQEKNKITTSKSLKLYFNNNILIKF